MKVPGSQVALCLLRCEPLLIISCGLHSEESRVEREVGHSHRLYPRAESRCII
jgi:hypothetical protein